MAPLLDKTSGNYELLREGELVSLRNKFSAQYNIIGHKTIYTQTTKMDLAGCIYTFVYMLIHTYMCNNNNQRKRDY